jgi:hypothetical protein
MILLPFLFAIDPVLTLPDSSIPLPQLLRDLERQAQIRFASTLDPKTSLRLGFNKRPLWPALDAIAGKLGAEVDLADRAVVRFVPARKAAGFPPTAYDGLFRFRVVRTQSTRDLVTEEGQTDVTIEVTWLPSVWPIFLDAEPECTITDSDGRTYRTREFAPSLVPTTNRGTMNLLTSIPVLPRQHSKIARIEGKLSAVVLRDRVTFSFPTRLDKLLTAPPQGDQRTLTVQRITCRVTQIVLGRDRWTVKMQLDYPPGANRDFESYQAGSMVVANELMLLRTDGKQRMVPTASVVDETSPLRTVVTYHFTDTATQKRTQPETWTLRYSAPSGIVNRELSFSFKDVPLP